MCEHFYSFEWIKLKLCTNVANIVQMFMKIFEGQVTTF